MTALELVIKANTDQYRAALKEAESALTRMANVASHAFDSFELPEIDLKQALDTTGVATSAEEIARLGQAFVALKAAAGDIDAFKQIQADVDAAAESLVDAKKKKDFLLESAAKGGDAGIKLFAADIEKAKREVNSAAEALRKKRAAAAQMSLALSKSGVDVAKLASEETKLKAALDAATGSLEKSTAVEAARNKLGVRPYADIRADIKALEAAYATLKTSGKVSFAELAQAKARLTEKTRELRQSMTATTTASGGMANALGAVRGVVAAVSAAIAGSMILKYSDEMQLLRGRLLLVEGSHAGVNRAMKEIARIALATGTDIGAVGNSYFRFASAIQKVGGTSRDALRFTEAVARSLKLSGASAEEAGNTMRQLSQSLMKGKLDGDEFRSVAENGGLVLDYLAKALGKTRGELMQMSSEGKLTTKELIKLGDSLEKIQKDSKNLPKTVGDGIMNVKNAAKIYADQSTLVQGASNAATGALGGLANNFDGVARSVAAVTFAGISIAIAGLVSRYGHLALAAGRFAVGLHPIGRALIVAGSAAVAFSDQIRDMWRAVFASNSDKAVYALDELTGALKKAGETIKGEMANGIALANASIKTLGESYKAATETIKQALADKLAAVQRTAEAEKQALANAGGMSEASRLAAETAAVREAAANRNAVIRDSAAQQIAVAEATYSRLEGLARTAGQSVAAVEQEGLRAKQDIYRQIADAYRATVDQLIAEENRLMGEIRSLDAERVRMKMSTEDQLRDLARTAMNDYAAAQDRQAQVDQKQAASRQALAQGNFTIAKQLAEEANRLAAQNAREVKLPGADGKMQVVVTQAQAVARAMIEIKESAALADAAVAGKTAVLKQQVEGVKGATDQAKTALSEIETKLDAVTAKAAKGIDVKIKADLADADAIIAKFKSQVENEKFLATVQANLEKAQADVDAWRKDPENTALKMQAVAAIDAALAQIETLKTQAAQRKIPLEVDLAAARTALTTLQTDLRQPTGSTHSVTPETRQAQDAINALKADTSSTHTVYVRQIEQRATGGLIGAVQRLATGGQVFRRQIGHIFGPGTGTSDSVPLMGSAGEYMVRAASVRKYGVAFLDNLNRGLFPTMDIAGAAAPVAARAERGQSAAEMKLTLHGPRGETVRVTSERDEAQRLVRLLRNAGVKLS